MKRVTLCLAIQLLLCVNVQGSASAPVADAGATRPPQAARTDEIAKDRGSAGAEARGEAPGLPVIEADCLKEGESCNVLMNRCCPGLSCQGGLVATCVRNREP